MITTSTAQRAATCAFGLFSAGLLALTGCTSAETPAPASPEPPRPTSSAPPPVPSTAPPVANPVDIRPFAKRPCALLTRQEFTRLGFNEDDDDGPDTEPIGRPRYCSANGQDRVDVRIEPFPNRDKLTFELEDGPGTYQVFELRNISGFPALLQQREKTADRCYLTVRIAINQSLEVEVGEGDFPIGGERCRRAVLTADAALAKLKPLRG